MLIDTQLVPMPDKKIGFKKGKNGTLYVYYTVRSYRRKKDGKPTSDEVCIGKKDLNSGMLIPNKRYLYMFEPVEDLLPSMINKIWGSIYILKKRAEAISITKTLQNIFPRQWQDILLSACYMVLKGNV